MRSLAELEAAYTNAVVKAERVLTNRYATLDQLDRAEAKRDAAKAALDAAKAAK